MAERCAVYPGTFDPITFGHIDVIKRAGRVFDRIAVAITDNPRKDSLFSLEERMKLAKQSTAGMNFVEVKAFSGLLVDFLEKEGCPIILRGLRELSDFEFEFQQAVVNRKLAPNVDTFFVMTSSRFFYLSSSMVKEIASLGGKLEPFVPQPVEKALREKFRKRPKTSFSPKEYL